MGSHGKGGRREETYREKTLRELHEFFKLRRDEEDRRCWEEDENLKVRRFDILFAEENAIRQNEVMLREKKREWTRRRGEEYAEQRYATYGPQTVDELLTAFDERRTEERQRIAREDKDRLARQRKIARDEKEAMRQAEIKIREREEQDRRDRSSRAARTGQIIESREERKARAARAEKERLDRFEAGVREQEEWCRKRRLRRVSPFYDEQSGGECDESESEDDQEEDECDESESEDDQEEDEDGVNDDLARAISASRISERQEREARGRSSKVNYNAQSPPARRRQGQNQRRPEPPKKQQQSTPISPPNRPRNQGAADSYRRPTQVQVPSYSGVPQHHQRAKQMPVPSKYSGYEQPYYANSDRPVAELEAVESHHRRGNMAPPSAFNTNRSGPSRPSRNVHWSSPVARPASPGNYEDLESAGPYFHSHGHYPTY
ncbi:hypothetical protein B0T24DRAFT_594414 [Lasiosphaeria ovina]|uniref:Uncharacterized protein n=1 Tax=Lasiosphaeria ovina TaxID=92902 RepID=A0AAE0KDT2_9PEZI|nr:hypothetical protein B0T24DRAFT_594414 [Lasiosphaeria ovina]